MQDPYPSSNLAEAALSIVLQKNLLPCDSWLFRTLPLVAKPFKQIVDRLNYMDLHISLVNELQARAVSSWLGTSGRVERVAKLTLDMDKFLIPDYWWLMRSDCFGLVQLGELLSAAVNSEPIRCLKGALTTNAALVAAANRAKRNGSSASKQQHQRQQHLQELTINNAALLSNPMVLQAFLPLMRHVQHLKLVWQSVIASPVRIYFYDACEQVEQQKLVMQLLLSQVTQLQSLELHWIRTHLPTQCYLPYTLAGLTNLTRLTLSGLTLTASSFMPVEQAEQRMEQHHGPGWRVPGGAGYGAAFPWGDWRGSAAGDGGGISSSSSSGAVNGLVVLPKLRHLEVRRTAGWEDISFHQVAQLLPSLEYLHVAFTPDQEVHLGIQDFAGFKKLRELMIVHQSRGRGWHDCLDQGGEGVIDWEAWGRFRKAVPTLEVLCAINLEAPCKHATTATLVPDEREEHSAPPGFRLNYTPVALWQKDRATAPLAVLPIQACLEEVRGEDYNLREDFDSLPSSWHNLWLDAKVRMDDYWFERKYRRYQSESDACDSDWDYWEPPPVDPLPLELTCEGDACYDASTCCSRRRGSSSGRQLVMKHKRQKGGAGRQQEAHHLQHWKLKDKGNVKTKNAAKKQVDMEEVQNWRSCIPAHGICMW
jgi:hypothetical protein